MSRKTVRFRKQLAQATRKGRDVSEAKALLTPTRKVLGEGRKRYKNKEGKLTGGNTGTTVTLPRKPVPKV